MKSVQDRGPCFLSVAVADTERDGWGGDSQHDRSPCKVAELAGATTIVRGPFAVRVAYVMFDEVCATRRSARQLHESCWGPFQK